MIKYKPVRQLKENLLGEGDYKSIRELAERIARVCPENKILAELGPDKQMKYYNARDLYNEICNLGDGLIAAGLKDAHIAIVADNCCRYVISDMSISSGVGVVVPLDKDAPEELLVTFFEKADIDAVLFSSHLRKKVSEACAQCPRVKVMATMDIKLEGLPCYDEYVAEGERLFGQGKSVYRGLELNLDSPAKILFTSGTTGANKAVMLTGANLAANCINCMDTIMAPTKPNTSMSVLPMHHATEINTHIMGRIGGGDLTYINDSIRTMMPNMKLYKPHITTIVPMIAEAFYRTIWANARKQGKEEKLRKGIALSNFLRKFGIDITHKLFADIYDNFGGNLNMIVCGGSMLNPVVVKGLNDIGIRVENGYGITECGPLISMNSDTLDDHLSVGKPCPQLEVRLEDTDSEGVGELCVRGKSVAKGYYKDPAATAEVFGADGFFNTGDSAYIKDGKVYLIGRKKNTIVLSNGKNVCPEEVENVIASNLFYALDVVVYQAESESSASQSVLCAGLYIDDETVRADREKIISDIVKINSLLPSYKAIDYVELPDKPYEKTSSAKIKRAVLPTKCSGEGIRII